MSNEKGRDARQLTLGLADDTKMRGLVPATTTEALTQLLHQELTDALQEILFVAAMTIVEEADQREGSDED